MGRDGGGPGSGDAGGRCAGAMAAGRVGCAVAATGLPLLLLLRPRAQARPPRVAGGRGPVGRPALP